MRTTIVRMSMSAACAVTLLALAAVPAVHAADAPPQETSDGLQLVKSTKSRLVYVKPGATFSQYGRVAILECEVQFEKDWQRDYNSSHVGLEGRVTDSDVERMKTDLAAEFKKVFIDELQNKGGYQVVDVVAADVLVLRPALLNVEVNAPDLMTASIGSTVVRSAGQMTLYLELWDPSTKTLLARVEDAQADDQNLAQRADRVTNKVAADRILREWAEELRARLDTVMQKPAQ
jgi:RNase H-fold protein (predicted Holliday junction resolvase)